MNDSYDWKWACFCALECMSHPDLPIKKIGYVIASNLFTTNEDVMLLTTNFFKKVSVLPLRIYVISYLNRRSQRIK